MIVVYGPKPGTEVTVPLRVVRPESVTVGGKTVRLPKREGVEGDVAQLTLRVPSEGDRRELRYHLSTTTVEVVDGKDSVRLQTSQQAVDRYNAAVIRKLVVRLDGYAIKDPAQPGAAPFEVKTADEIVMHADDDTIQAIVELVTDRLKITEALRGNSDGRSTSSTPAIPAPAVTAESVGSSTSAELARVTAPPSAPTSTSAAPA